MKNDGGPAYPTAKMIPSPHGNYEVSATNPGMSKRFYAACAALQGFLARNNEWKGDASEMAHAAFQMADVMLAEEGRE